jgi:hypothetical protein
MSEYKREWRSLKMEINSLSIMEVKTKDKTLQLKQEDVIAILLKDDKVINPVDCTIRGRITFIDFEAIVLDCSKEYKSDIRTIKFKDISSLFKIK